MSAKKSESRSLLLIGADHKWSLESSYNRAFRQLGWNVHTWEPAKALNKIVRGKRLGQIFSNFVNVEPWLRKANLELIHLAAGLRPEVILVIGTDIVRAGTLGQLRAQLPHSIFYCLFPDTPHNLTTERIQALPFFDRVCTVSPGWVDAFVRSGATRVHYLPPAADTYLHRPAFTNGSNPIRPHDVAFIGIWRREREALLEQLVDFDLGVWGSYYWNTKTRPNSPLRSRWGGRPLFGAEFANACAQSRILLNIIDSVGWPGPNMRVFEQPACRAFSLVTRTPAVLEIFKEGETIECFESAEEARQKIRYYLDHDEARLRIVEASYKLVVEGGHTYLDRAKQIIAWVDQDLGQKELRQTYL